MWFSLLVYYLLPYLGYSKVYQLHIEINCNTCILHSDCSPRPTPSSKHVFSFKLFTCLSGNYSHLEKTFIWASVWKNDEGKKCISSIFLKVAEKATGKSNRHRFSFACPVNVTVLSSSCLPWLMGFALDIWFLTLRETWRKSKKKVIPQTSFTEILSARNWPGTLSMKLS